MPTERERDEAARLFSWIDSSIAFMFEANLASARRFEIIDLDGSHGAYFCYDDDGVACVYAAFERENDASAARVAELCAEDIRSLGSDGVVYLWSENSLTIDRLRRDLGCVDERGMTELMLSRADHRPVPLPPELTVRDYEKSRLADYLSLLDVAMTYQSEPRFYTDRAERYAEEFSERDGFFKAFFAEDRLVGLYLRGWRCGDELSLLAVHPNSQRKGYGAALLSHAASALFSSDERDDLTLYCMDSNPSAIAFYISRGLRVTGRSYRMALSLR